MIGAVFVEGIVIVVVGGGCATTSQQIAGRTERCNLTYDVIERERERKREREVVAKIKTKRKIRGGLWF